MLRQKILPFVVASLLSFAAFTAIASGLQAAKLFPVVSQVDAAQQTWQALGITNYRIEVTKSNSIWHMQTYTITVRDNQVVEQSAICIPAPIEGRTCEVEAYEAVDYIVSGLFAAAQDLLQRRGEHTVITYDATYHFPLIIRYNDPQIYDDDLYWEVSSFEVLP